MTKKLSFKRERRFLEYLKDIKDCLKEHHLPILFPDPKCKPGCTVFSHSLSHPSKLGLGNVKMKHDNFTHVSFGLLCEMPYIQALQM